MTDAEKIEMLRQAVWMLLGLVIQPTDNPTIKGDRIVAARQALTATEPARAARD